MRIKQVKDIIQKPDMPVGRFASWLHNIRKALIEEKEVDVPCGEC